MEEWMYHYRFLMRGRTWLLEGGTSHLFLITVFTHAPMQADLHTLREGLKLARKIALVSVTGT